MIEDGDRIILRTSERLFFVQVGEKTFSTDLGMINLAEAVGKESGDQISTHLGTVFTILIPRPTDFFAHGKRSGAPMLPKDIGMVIASTGMNYRDNVLDAGCGSGIAAIYFGSVAKSVTSYEIRDNFAAICRGNVQEAGLENVNVITGDVLDAEGTFDVVHLDLHITPEHVTHAYNLLVPGGYLATYTPFLEQTFIVLDTAEDLFGEVTCHELMDRELSRSKRGTRPSTRVAHSGYITICRK